MILFNGSCDNYIYGNGKPVTCNECEGMLRGGFGFPCNFKAENSFICDQNAYSFNDTSNNSNYLPQPQYENYLCNLCGNNSHDGYDCQQLFSFVYEQEPRYNQNYNDNYYPHDLSSFPCFDNCGGSHETFQCQPMDQNIDFSCSDQIQTPQYPDVHPPSQEISYEVFHAKEDLMKSIETFLEEFHCIHFEEKATILLQTWFKFFAIKHDQPEDSKELFQKLLEDLKELAEYKESLENSSNEISILNSNEDKEEPLQDSDIHQLIEECSTKVSKEQKQSMEDTMLELVKINRQKKLLCIHDNVDDLIESVLNTKLLSINSQRLDKKEQEVKNVVEQPAERGNRTIESLQNFRVIHKNTISLKNTSQFSSIQAVTPILSTKEHEYSPSMGYEHSNTTLEMELDEIINDDDDFEDIEYVEASLSDPEIVSVEEENVVQQEEEETRSGNTTTHADDSLPEYDLFCFEIEPDQERLINVLKNDIPDDSNDLLLEEADLFLSDNSIPPEPSDAEYDAGEKIPVVMNDKDKNVDYSSYIFVIFAKVFSLLSAESEDTIFDPGIFV
nr:hypothetical protein [Tanacetum cinerariifolium]